MSKSSGYVDQLTVRRGDSLYRTERVAVRMNLTDEEVARVVGSRVTGGEFPFKPHLARLLANKLLDMPGAITLEKLVDHTIPANVAMATIHILVKEK